ncbi:MAG: MFS transporter [Gammaproteobacteria bacterium]|nr:MFS transporter [Gammaproteobacteria bacterium]
MNAPAENFRSRLLLIGFGMTVFAIGQSLVFMIVTPMARSTGLTEVQFGLVLTFASLPLVIFAPYWGKKSDQVGRKPIFLLGLAGSAIGTLLVAFALEARLAGFISVGALAAGLFFARGLYSATGSAIYPASGGYIADVTTLQDRSKGMAILGASNSLGTVLGSLLAVGLSFAGVLVPMYVAAGLMLATALLASKLLKEPERHAVTRQASTLKLFDRRLRPFMIMWFCFFLTFSSVQLTSGFFIQDKLALTDPAAVVRVAGLCLISMSVVIIVAQGLVLQVLHIGPQMLLRLCGPVVIASLLALSAADTTLGLCTGFGLLGLAFSLATPGINGGGSLAVAAHEQGTASGYLAAANTVGAVLGPLTGTSLYRIGPQALFYAGAALFVLVSLYALTIVIPSRHGSH